ARGRWDPEDATLLSDIDEGATIVRVPEPEVTGRARLSGWLDRATDAALEAIREHQPEVALITMSPFELTEIGDRLRAATSIPVVYDLRDPWALDGWRLYSTKTQWKRDFERMKQALGAADGVVANTPESKKAFLASIPALTEERTTVISNGFDAEDFDHDLAPLESDRLWLVHTGTLHTRTLYEYEGLKGRLKKLRHHRPERIEPSGRTPQYLLRAVKRLREEEHPLGEKLRIAFIGLSDPHTERCVAESGVSDCVRIEGYLSHQESVHWLQRAHALFLPLHGFADRGRSLIVPGKVYEYLAARRPILACVPPGDARDIVEETGHAFVAEPCDEGSIMSALTALSEDIEANGLTRDLPESLRRYERRNLTEELARFLDHVSQRRSSKANAGA
ncbi:MAG: glycosyltransferase, partial [Planctomycetota bacterium]